MPRALLAGLALLAPLLGGCVAPGLSLGTLPPELDRLLPAADPLWPDRQNAPHPAFGWPTLTHPATGADVPAWWRAIPAAELPSSIAGLAHVAKSPSAVVRGGGTALFGSLAVVPGYGERSSILDISDPTHPQLLAQTEIDPTQIHRGAAIIAYPNGTLVALFSTPHGIQAFDITDPTAPAVASTVTLAKGHKLGLVPGTPIVYNANNRGGVTNESRFDPKLAKGQTEILDYSDPWNPVLVGNFTNGYGCHHIFFWSDASQDKHRAICAGKEMTQLWDIADPLDPKVIVNIPFPHGNTLLPSGRIGPAPPPLDRNESMPAGTKFPSSFSHTAFLSYDGDVLLVGDEFMGGTGPAECGGVRTPAKDLAGPFGNLWFYDISVETQPVLKGWVNAEPHNVAEGDRLIGCTAHHGRLVPDPEGRRDLVVMAWYNAGVLLIDFTDPSNPRILDAWDDATDTWEAWYYQGYVFTGDRIRGLDVLRFR